MEIDEVINAIYSGDADDACERLRQWLDTTRASSANGYALAWDIASVCHRIPVAAQKARNAAGK